MRLERLLATPSSDNPIIPRVPGRREYSLESLEAALAATSLWDFTCTTFRQYKPKWYHKFICLKLDKLLSGEIKRLMIFCPPQHGKSELVSRRLPAYALGLNPALQIASCSYGAEFASHFNRQVQRIIDDDMYRKIFPATRLSSKNVAFDAHGSWLRNSETFEVVNHGGRYNAVGVGGPLTGKTVDLGIIDDPIKDAMEAGSEITRQRLWEWYTDVFTTRLHNDSRVLLTMTRWHEDDLAGRILAAEKGQWEVLVFRGLKEEVDLLPEDRRLVGEALWPERHSAEKIISVKQTSERTYTALYQQRPAPMEGGIFKRKWWKFYDQLPDGKPKLLVSWDMTFKETGTSYIVGQVWAKYKAECYLIDMLRGKWDFPTAVKQVVALHKKYPTAWQTLIEEKANGAAIIDTLKRDIPGIIPIKPTESKEARASAVSYLVEAGNIYLPRGAAWIDLAILELCSFPNAANDDIVDCLTQALNHLYRKSLDYEALTTM